MKIYILLIAAAILVSGCVGQTSQYPATLPSEDYNNIVQEAGDAAPGPVSELPGAPEPQPAGPQGAHSYTRVLGDFSDSFDGDAIDSRIYSAAIGGTGTITQDGKIIIRDGGTEKIVWDLVYTNQDVDFTKDFTITVDVDLTGTAERGDITAIAGVESRNLARQAKVPQDTFCEVTARPDHAFLRVETADEPEGTTASITGTGTKGTLVASFNPKIQQFTCSFGGKTIEARQLAHTGSYALTLRAGLRTQSETFTAEFQGTGDFTAAFDNLRFETAAKGE